MLPPLEQALEKIAELENRIAHLEKLVAGNNTLRTIPHLPDRTLKIAETTLPKPAAELVEAAIGSEPGQPEHLCPQSAIEEKFPQIAEKISLVWGHPECLTYLGGLIIDNRGNRKGFNLDVMGELMMLLKITEHVTPDMWAGYSRPAQSR